MPAVDAQLQPAAGLATAGQPVATASVQDLQEAAALLEAFLGTQCDRYHNPCDMCHEALALLIIAIDVLLRCVPELVLELLHVVIADYDPAKLLDSCGQVARCILATQDYTCTA